MSDLLLLRLLSPKLFRGVRFYLVVWFWLFVVVMLLGFAVEVFRPHDAPKPAPATTHKQIGGTHQ